MFETAIIVAALVRDFKRNEDLADRRAFYGPDVEPSREERRRTVRLPRFMRRGTHLA